MMNVFVIFLVTSRTLRPNWHRSVKLKLTFGIHDDSDSEVNNLILNQFSMHLDAAIFFIYYFHA